MSDFIVSGSPDAAHVQQADDPGSLPKRIVDTFFAPILLFRRFQARAPWWDVLLVAAVLTGACTLLLPRDIMVRQIEEALRQAPQQAGAPTPSMDMMVMFGRIGGVVGPLVTMPLMALVVAGLCTLVFGRLMGGGGGFRPHLAVASHAMLILLLGTVVTIFFVILSGDANTRLSLALLVPGLEAESLAGRVLKGLDVFNLWFVILVGVGAAAVNRRVSNATALAVALGVYLAGVVSWAAIRG